jgi:glycosyltransferase involved in cell wall biosynthesis
MEVGMRITFFSTSTQFSGGRLAMFRHADALARCGHDVSIRIQGDEPTLDWLPVSVPVQGFTEFTGLPKADVCVFDRIRLAEPLVKSGLGRVVHLCQGFEGTDAELRQKRAWSERGLFGLADAWRQRRRLRRVARAYRLPTAKIVVHPHLGELLARLFEQQSHFVPYGLADGVFAPPPSRARQPSTVLIVGPTDVGWKRVPDALKAMQILKRKRPVRVVRVAQHPQRDIERGFGVTDEYHTMLAPQRMANLYREADAMLCSSDATEGFGLPALEAMACGLPCVLTDIPAFRTFAKPDDYAKFVPVGDTDAMADAMERLLNSADERKRLSLRGVAVAAEYTTSRSHAAMDAALHAIAGSNSAPRIAA